MSRPISTEASMCVEVGSLTVTPSLMWASRMRRLRISSARASWERSLTRFASSGFLSLCDRPAAPSDRLEYVCQV